MSLSPIEGVDRPGTCNVQILNLANAKKLGSCCDLQGFESHCVNLEVREVLQTQPGWKWDHVFKDTTLVTLLQVKKIAHLIKLTWPQTILIYLKYYRCPVFQHFEPIPQDFKSVPLALWRTTMEHLKSKPKRPQRFAQWIVLYTPTVDGRNPAPPGMYKTLSIVGYLPYQLVQDFSHQQY